jgi:drug/metabolite transporter (DMT)-like permease
MGILLATIASISFVGLDVLRKVLGRRLSATEIVIGLNLGSMPVFTAVLLRFGGWEFDLTFVLIASAEAFSFTLASVLYIQAVTLSPLSLTIPYLAFTPVVSALVAIPVLGEIPTPKGSLGICLVVLGAFFLHLEEGKSLRALLGAPFREPGSWRMLVVALIFGTTTSLDKIAISHGSEALLGLTLTTGSTFVLLGFRFLRQTACRQDPEMRLRGSSLAGDRLLLLAALVAAVAILAQFFAYREMLVAYVETIKRGGGLLSAMTGIFFFREGGFANRVPAAVMMVVGIALIVL